MTTKDIAAEPQRVWSVLTDIENAPQVLRGVISVEVLTAPPFRVGTRWRETRRMMGREETQELEVTALDTLGRMTVESAAGDITYTTTFTLTPLRPGTRVTMTFDGSVAPSAGLVSRVIGAATKPIGALVMRRVMSAELDDIAAAAERQVR
ncbi:MAG: SRPBCC family protein [Mobilicoccus sp.]|nr:SRPBCC family protein [Mobilicoccus sp.]